MHISETPPSFEGIELQKLPLRAKEFMIDIA
jgi:hypothetical protein